MKKRILILDDDQSILEILNEVFSYEGFDAITVETTDDLLELVRRYEPALILLDYALNGKNGGTWCQQLKDSSEFSHIPVVIFSAYSNKGICKGSFGCDEFIAKPFDLEDLVSPIKTLISQEK